MIIFISLLVVVVVLWLTIADYDPDDEEPAMDDGDIL
jgi:hypothetical protein